MVSFPVHIKLFLPYFYTELDGHGSVPVMGRVFSLPGDNFHQFPIQTVLGTVLTTKLTTESDLILRYGMYGFLPPTSFHLHGEMLGDSKDFHGFIIISRTVGSHVCNLSSKVLRNDTASPTSCLC